MVSVKMFGPLRLKTGFRNFTAEIHSVREACAVMKDRTGFPENSFAIVSLQTISAMSWPFISMTCHPKAFHFSSSG